jgi:hypothetical protein
MDRRGLVGVSDDEFVKKADRDGADNSNVELPAFEEVVA